MGQHFIKKNSWVDIHGIYCIVKNGNQIWWSFVFNKAYHFQLEWRWIELKKLLQKWRWQKISKQYTKDIINGYVYVEKTIYGI